MPFGLYLHIPFCKQKCPYCDFYSRPAGEAVMDAYLAALLGELDRSVAAGEIDHADTVYLGGGTPSLMGAARLAALLEGIGARIPLAADAEITLECNPESTTPSLLRTLRRAGYNRVSFGVQSLDDRELRALGRLHDAMGAKRAVAMAREAGFDNLSIDLIYGLPGETDARWQADLQQAVRLRPEHVSAYHLMYEEETTLYRYLLEHRVCEVDEDASVRFYHRLTDTLSEAGYVHYEISNFCLPGRHARHNASYWQGIPYLGCGASAHSYDGRSREWNVASIEAYMQGMERGERPHEVECLDADTRYNEYVMTGLRTRWGISLDQVAADYGKERLAYLERMARPHLQRGMMAVGEGRLRLTEAGVFVSDDILSDLMYV